MHFFIGLFFALICIYLIVGLIGWKGFAALIGTGLTIFVAIAAICLYNLENAPIPERQPQNLEKGNR